MDNTKEFILQCEKAVEIQELWDRRMGSFYCESYWSNEEQKDLYVINVLKSDNQYIYQPRFTWLPRQDQLQEMLNKELADLVWDFGAFLYPMNSSVHYDGKSMEQLWLAFVMYEKYNKTWNGEDWVL